MNRWFLFSLVLSALWVAVPRSALAQGADALAAPPPPQGASVPQAPSSPIPPPPGQGTTSPPPGYGVPAVPPVPGGSGVGRTPDVSPRATARLSANMTTRLRVLDADLQLLGARGNNIADGIIGIATGGLSIALAFLIADDNAFLRRYLILYGAANVLTGVVDIAVRPNAQGPAIAFTHMPMSTPAEAQARLEFGEAQLERIARRARIARLTDASISIAVGLAIIPIYLGPNDFSIADPFDYFVLLGSGISVITGVINLARRSSAEKRWGAYRDLRGRLERDRQRAQLGVAPVRGGVVLTLGGAL